LVVQVIARWLRVKPLVEVIKLLLSLFFFHFPKKVALRGKAGFSFLHGFLLVFGFFQLQVLFLAFFAHHISHSSGVLNSYLFAEVKLFKICVELAHLDLRFFLKLRVEVESTLSLADATETEPLPFA
jgi:hypothetical protein